MANVILVFPSNSGTMVATKTLRDSGVQAKMIPTPPSVQSTANLCLSIDGALKIAALAALEVANISVTAMVL
jgi:hypothetical protein